MDRRRNHLDVWKDTWLDHYFDLPLWGRAFVVGLLAALLGVALDEIAHAFGFKWLSERLLENAVEGVVIGVVVFWLSRLREQRIERRMREIGFLNHHIRNAMQTIEWAVKEVADTRQRVTMIDLSVRRVVQTLSRISRESDELSVESGHHYAA
ncbi:MAG TPA: hypothetical protein VKE93_03265 [Candidatus Angelobacter sp.]|nr:hypothetical protein [Candidatus Angelobacter sp.]